MYGRFHSVQKYGSARIGSGQFELVLPKDRWLAFSVARVCEQRFHTIANLNLPGIIVGAPFSLPAVAFLRRHPTMLSPKSWHTVTVAFFGLPAWWFVGLGVERLLTRRRMPWSALAFGSALCLACIAFAIGIVTSAPIDKVDLLPFLPGALLWTIAFGLFPFLWMLQKSPAKWGRQRI